MAAFNAFLALVGGLMFTAALVYGLIIMTTK